MGIRPSGSGCGGMIIGMSIMTIGRGRPGAAWSDLDRRWTAWADLGTLNTRIILNQRALDLHIYRLRLFPRRFFYYICIGYRTDCIARQLLLSAGLRKGNGGSPAPDGNSCLRGCGEWGCSCEARWTEMQAGLVVLFAFGLSLCIGVLKLF